MQETCDLCTRLRTEGIKAMSRGFSGGQQVLKFANIQEIAIGFVHCRQQKIITFYLTDDNSNSYVEVIIVTFWIQKRP